ncbi:MAG TPA: PAS domain S-box protein [Gaiellaceae bacterium]|jgi:PAS domain S-box-containing protein
MAELSDLVERQLEIASLTGEIDAVMRAIVEGAREALGGDGAALTVQRGNELVFTVAVGSSAPLEGSSILIDDSLGGRCFLERRTLVVDDLYTEPTAEPVHTSQLQGGSMVLSPLVHGERALGVLSVHARGVGAFTEDAASTTALMARSAAIALRNAELVAHLASAEQASRALVEQGADAMLVLDGDGGVLAGNRAAETLLGYGPGELAGLRDTDLFADSRAAAETLRGAAFQRRRELRGERRFRRCDGTLVDVELAARLLDDGRIHTSFRDITRRKQNEDRLHVSLGRLRSIVAMQREISELVPEPEAVTEAILERAQRLTGADAAVVLWLDPEGPVWRHGSGEAAEYLGHRADPEGSLAGLAAQTRQTHYAPDTLVDPRVDREATRRFGFRSVISAPLLRGNEPVAVLSVASKQPHAFDEIAVETTRLMAEFVSAALRNTEELETRRRMAEQLRTQGQVVEHMRTALHVWQLDDDDVFRLSYANAASEQAMGVPVADVLGRTIAEVLPGSPDEAERLFRQLLESERGIFDAGEIEYGDDRVSPRIFAMKMFTLGPRRVAVTFENVTESVQAARALRESEERFRGAFDAASAGMALVTLGGEFVQVNDRLAAMLGYTREELLPLGVRGITHPADLHLLSRNRDQLANSASGVFEAERRYVRKDGSIMWGHLAVAVVRDYEGRPLHRVVHVIDVTQRKEAEQLFAAGFERSVVPMVIVDDERALTDANDAALELLGVDREEALGLGLAELLPGEPVARGWRRFLARGVAEGEATFQRPDGGRRLIEFTATAHVQPGHHMVVLRDLTTQRDLELQLRQAQRMEAVGRLAGGIAHDFNNLLTAISGYSEFLTGRIEDPKLRHHAEEIRRAAARAAALTGQLLAFSRRQVLQPRVLDLNGAVADMESMLRRLIGEDVELITMLDADPSHVRADPTQIEQVIVNLAVNARDAMPGGGSAIIGTGNVDADEGEFVELTFADTGVGMSRNERQHLFDPFFTTKEGGTGLGLATVYGIVEQTGGTIEVDSEPGSGSTFRIRLPRAVPEAEEEAPPEAAAPAAGSETILLVEDENVVRQLVAEILESSGYTVLQAADGPSALELLRRHSGPVDLLLTDVVMPGMSGPDVAKAVSSMRPGTQVLYTSGYTDSAIDHHGVLRPGIAFLQKPFSADDLTRKVRSLVEEQAAGAA